MIETLFATGVAEDAETLGSLDIGGGNRIELKVLSPVSGSAVRAVVAAPAAGSHIDLAGVIQALTGADTAHLPGWLRDILAVEFLWLRGIVADGRLMGLNAAIGLPGRHALVPGLVEVVDPQLGIEVARHPLDPDRAPIVSVAVSGTLVFGKARIAIRAALIDLFDPPSAMPERSALEAALRQAAITGLDDEILETLLDDHDDARRQRVEAPPGSGFEIEGRLVEPVPIAEVLAHFGLDFPVDARIETLDFLYDGPGGRYRFAIDVAGHLKLFDSESLTLEEIFVRIEGTTGAASAVRAVFGARLALGPLELALSAEMGRADAGWLISGSLELTDTEALDAALRAGFGLGLPDGLGPRLVLAGFDISFDTGAGQVAIAARGGLRIGGTEIDATIDIEIARAGGAWDSRFAGVLTIRTESHGSFQLDLELASDSDGFRVAAALHQDSDEALPLSGLAAALDPNLRLPEIRLRVPALCIAHHAAGTGAAATLLGLEIEGGLDLTAIHLDGFPIAEALKTVLGTETLRLTAQVLVLSSGDATPGKLAADSPLARLATDRGLHLPKEGVEPGVSVTATLEVGAVKHDLGVPLALEDGTLKLGDPRPAGGGSAGTGGAPEVRWLDVHRAFGPLTLERIGLSARETRLTGHMIASVSVGGLTVSLDGLTVSADLTDLAHPSFELAGLGVGYSAGPVAIAGAFLHLPDGSGFAGKVVVRTAAFGLGAVGLFGQHDGHPSLMLYGVLDYPLGGPGFFFVEGLAGGFGYNRRFRAPAIEAVESHPFVAAAKTPAPATHRDPLAEVTGLAQAVPAEIGSHFLAVGLRFTSFKVVSSFALAVARFGDGFELDLMGLSEISNPPGVPQPLVWGRMAWAARFAPDEGVLSLQAQIMPGAYLFDRSCRLSGCFAFVCWFHDQPGGGARAGDFVMTIGGYHPAYDRPRHYPDVPRLALNWQVTPKLSLKGAVYLALTPHAVMAGGRLDAVWQDGSLRAWFSFSADFLISWEPYHYDASVTVNLGVSVTIKVIWTKTFSLDASARLHVWGPEFACRAEVHLKVIGIHIDFTISYHDGAALPQAVDLGRFRGAFLPEKPITIACRGGSLPGSTDGSWKVSADTLEIEIGFAAPSTTGNSGLIGVPPMGVAPGRYESHVDVELTRDGSVVDHGRLFAMQRVTSSLPAALWGSGEARADHGKLYVTPPQLNGSRMIDGAVTGLRFTPKRGAAIPDWRRYTLGASPTDIRLPDINGWETVSFDPPRPSVYSMRAIVPLPVVPEDGTPIGLAPHRVPVMAPGDYRLSVSQHLRTTNGLGKFEEANLGPVEGSFLVGGPRFALEQGDIRAVHPANGAGGDFGAVLPHLVLARSSLPWERSALPGRAPASGDDPAPPAPWLALVLLTEAEEAEVRRAPGRDGLLGTATLRSVTGGVTLLSEPELRDGQILFPTLPHENGDPEGGQVQVIDLARSLAARILPGAEALARQSVVARDGAGLPEIDRTMGPPGGNVITWGGGDARGAHPNPPRIPDAPDSAILIADRRPAPGRNTLLLLSLEGRMGPLGRIDAQSANAAYVRHVCLGHWRFQCQGDRASRLEDIAQRLSRGQLRGEQPASVFERAGSALMTRRKRGGGTGQAWRRGPLVAADITRPESRDPLAARRAEDLVIEPAGGVPADLSYASAWEIGRLTALANPEVMRTLSRWWHCCLHADQRAAMAARLVHLPCPEPDAGPPFPDAWFDRLQSLAFLPLAHMVPDPGQLPLESLRAFRVDPFWVECLVAGALAVGRPLVGDACHSAEIEARLAAIRSSRRGGLLIRSELVTNWPELEVTAETAQGKPIPLAVSRPAPAILMAMAPAFPDIVHLRTPPELPHFEWLDAAAGPESGPG
jgi:hypothetical protein